MGFNRNMQKANYQMQGCGCVTEMGCMIFIVVIVVATILAALG